MSLYIEKKNGVEAGGFELAAIYGIIKQCGGFTAVLSEPGCRTIFKSKSRCKLSAVRNL